MSRAVCQRNWGLLPVQAPEAVVKQRHIFVTKKMHCLKAIKIHPLHTDTSVHLNTALSLGTRAAVSLYEEWNYTIYFLGEIRFHSGMSPLIDT